MSDQSEVNNKIPSAASTRPAPQPVIPVTAPASSPSNAPSPLPAGPAFSLTDLQRPPYWTRLGYRMITEELHRNRPRVVPARFVDMCRRLVQEAHPTPLKSPKRLRRELPPPTDGPLDSPFDPFLGFSPEIGPSFSTTTTRSTVSMISPRRQSLQENNTNGLMDDLNFEYEHMGSFETVRSEDVRMETEEGTSGDEVDDCIHHETDQRLISLQSINPKNRNCSIFLMSTNFKIRVPRDTVNITVRNSSNFETRGVMEEIGSSKFAWLQPEKRGPYHVMCRLRSGEVETIRMKYIPTKESVKIDKLVLEDQLEESRKVRLYITIGDAIGRLSLELHSDHLGQWEDSELLNGLLKVDIRCQPGNHILKLRWNDEVLSTGKFEVPGEVPEPKEPPTVLIAYESIPEIVTSTSVCDLNGNEVAVQEIRSGLVKLMDATGGVTVIQGLDVDQLAVHGQSFEFLDFENIPDSMMRLALETRGDRPEEDEGRSDDVQDPVQEFTTVTLLNFSFPNEPQYQSSTEARVDYVKYIMSQLEIPSSCIGVVTFGRIFNGFYKVDFELSMGTMDIWQLEEVLEDGLMYLNRLERGDDESMYMRLCQTETVEDTIILMCLKKHGSGVLSRMNVAHERAFMENREELLLGELFEKFPEDIATTLMRMPRRLKSKCQGLFGVQLPSPISSLLSIRPTSPNV